MFFGPDYKVLRGGSFGVSPVACRGTFRNWDYPQAADLRRLPHRPFGRALRTAAVAVA